MITPLKAGHVPAQPDGCQMGKRERGVRIAPAHLLLQRFNLDFRGAL